MFFTKYAKKIFILLLFIFSLFLYSSTTLAANPCKQCNEFREKYSFLIPENYLLNNATGNPLMGVNESPPLHLISVFGSILSVLIIIFGVFQLRKNKKYAILIGGIILFFLFEWMGLNARYLDDCFYYACNIRLSP
jgi:hypothetical protein